jgi:protein SCO1/2
VSASLLRILAVAGWLTWLVPQAAWAGSPDAALAGNTKVYPATGRVREVKAAERTVVIEHDAITNYMSAMTMPFRVKDADQLAGLKNGDAISFQLHVTETESWIDHIARTGSSPAAENSTTHETAPVAAQSPRPRNPLLDYAFTNQLGQPVRLSDFKGQALAITFFFTRCPIPDFCPRLSKNFQAASEKLGGMPQAPTNWHFLSVTFDPQFDSPAVLKAYAESYHYEPRHWTFLTGPADKIRELASGSDVSYQPENGLINHNFRTLIIDAAGHLQMVFPTSGDLSDAIVSEILKAAAVTNRSS